MLMTTEVGESAEAETNGCEDAGVVVGAEVTAAVVPGAEVPGTEVTGDTAPPGRAVVVGMVIMDAQGSTVPAVPGDPTVPGAPTDG
jgi:hypothetical protein